MRKITVVPVQSTLRTGEDKWHVTVWHNDYQSTVVELTKDELQELHVITSDVFMDAYGTITHTR
jgi:hypothetical protein